jgi:hypothetical protein
MCNAIEYIHILSLPLASFRNLMIGRHAEVLSNCRYGKLNIAKHGVVEFYRINHRYGREQRMQRQAHLNSDTQFLDHAWFTSY